MNWFDQKKFLANGSPPLIFPMMRSYGYFPFHRFKLSYSINYLVIRLMGAVFVERFYPNLALNFYLS